jgi:hypothetical protein
MRSIAGIFILSMALPFLAGCSQDWGKAAVQDVEHMHQTLVADHPGPVDPDDPEFKERLESSYQFALERARKADDFGGYLYAIRSFTVPFHDEHLKVGPYKLGKRTYKWPGFTVGLRHGEMVVIRRDDEAAPPLGARLVSADGKSVEQLVSERVKPYIGNWSLPGKRPEAAPYLFINTGNPFIADLANATFESNGAATDYPLTWRKADAAMVSDLLKQEGPTIKSTSGVRTLANGTVWITIADFTVTTPAAKASVDSLLGAIKAMRGPIASAPALVVDVRGNVGGATSAAVDIAKAIWGDGYVESIRPKPDRVDWRASKGNIAALDQFLPAIEKAYGTDSETYRSMARVRKGMDGALARGEPYVSDVKTYPAVTDTTPAAIPAHSYFLTDPGCVSACLDFADIATRVRGMVHIGKETAGDTHYLDIRSEKLPSGKGEIIFSVAAHRGRARADNQTYVPAHVWDGSIADTKALEAWVGELAEAGSDWRAARLPGGRFVGVAAREPVALALRGQAHVRTGRSRNSDTRVAPRNKRAVAATRVGRVVCDAAARSPGGHEAAFARLEQEPGARKYWRATLHDEPSLAESSGGPPYRSTRARVRRKGVR